MNMNSEQEQSQTVGTSVPSLEVSSGVGETLSAEAVYRLYMSGKIEEARDEAKQVLIHALDRSEGIDPETLQAVRLYVRCNRLLGNHDDSMELATRIGGLIKGTVMEGEASSVHEILKASISIALGRAMIEAGPETAGEGRSWLAACSKQLEDEPLASSLPELRAALYAELALGIGVDLMNKGNVNEAVETLKRAEGLFSDMAPESKEMLLQQCEALDLLAHADVARGDAMSAGERAIASFNKKSKILNDNHPEMISSLYVMGKAERTIGNFQAAHEAFQVASEIVQRKLPMRSDLVDALECGRLQAAFFLSSGTERDSVVKGIEECVKSIAERNTYSYAEADSALWAMASVITDQEFLVARIDDLERIDTALSKKYGSGHHLRAVSSTIIGDLYLKQGESALAESYIEDAYNIQLESLGSESHLTTGMLRRLVDVSIKQEDLSKAKTWAEKLTVLLPKDKDAANLLRDIEKLMEE